MYIFPKFRSCCRIYFCVWVFSDFATISGDCYFTEECISSLNFPSNYGNNEACTITMFRDAALEVSSSFEIESCCDSLRIGETDAKSIDDFPTTVSTGEVISWETDESISASGWEICFSSIASGKSHFGRIGSKLYSICLHGDSRSNIQVNHKQ